MPTDQHVPTDINEMKRHEVGSRNPQPELPDPSQRCLWLSGNFVKPVHARILDLLVIHGLREPHNDTSSYQPCSLNMLPQ